MTWIDADHDRRIERENREAAKLVSAYADRAKFALALLVQHFEIRVDDGSFELINLCRCERFGPQQFALSSVPRLPVGEIVVAIFRRDERQYDVQKGPLDEADER